MTFSTCSDLVRNFNVPYDTNGYYRALGVHWDASRAELRRAYQRLEGWNSHRLTSIMRTLLDADLRRRYDATPIGQFFRDEYVDYALRSGASRIIADLKAEGRLLEAELFEAEVTAPALEEPEPRWGWYMWGNVWPDDAALEELRSAVVAVFSRRGYEPRMFAVGIRERTPEAIWTLTPMVVGYRQVIFLTEGDRANEDAVEAILTDMLL